MDTFLRVPMAGARWRVVAAVVVEEVVVAQQQRVPRQLRKQPKKARRGARPLVDSTA